MNKVIRVDNYEISHFLNCPMSHFYRFEENLTPLGAKVGPAFGIVIHKAREEWHKYLKDRMIEVNLGDKKIEQEALDVGVKALHSSYQSQMGSFPFVSDHHTATNAETLFRKYVDRFPPTLYQPVEAEMPFVVELGTTPSGIKVEYTGAIDGLCRFYGKLKVMDLKTTSFFPGAMWAAQWRTSGAFMGYCWAAERILRQEISGLVLHGVWVHTPPKTTRGKAYDEYFRADLITYLPEQLEEWRQNILHAVDLREEMRESGKWIYNFSMACRFCDFKTLCSASPDERVALKNIYYKKATWNPLREERVVDE
jgi:hypothetical protein